MKDKLGWICLILVVGFLAGLQLVNYFTRPRGAEPTLSLDRQVEAELTFRRFTKDVDQTKLEESFKKAYDLVQFKPVTPQYAELRTALAILRKKEPLKKDLDLLRKGNQDQKWLAARADILDPATKPSAKVDDKLAYRIAREMNEARGDSAKALDKIIPSSTLVRNLLIALVASLLVMGSIILWAVWLSEKRPILPHPIGELSPGDANLLAALVAQALMFSFVVIPALTSALSEVTPLLVLALIRVVGMSLSVVPVVKAFPGILRLKHSFFKDLGYGFAGALMNVSFLIIGVILMMGLNKFLPPAEHPATVTLANNPNITEILLTFVAAVILAPFFEELLMRGALLPAIIKATGSRFWGFFATNLIFAMIHPTGIPAWPALALIGVASSMLVYRTGSLRASIFMHAIHNGATLLLVLLQN